jgi:hypothetical protein
VKQPHQVVTVKEEFREWILGRLAEMSPKGRRILHPLELQQAW